MIINLSQFGCVRVSGENAHDFLQGQLTCDMREITENKASYAAYCNHKGRTISVLRVLKVENDFYLFTTGTFVEPLLNNLKKFGQFSRVDVSLASPDLVHYGFCGDDAIDNLKEMIGEYIPTEINQVVQAGNYMAFKNVGENSFEMFSPPLPPSSTRSTSPAEGRGESIGSDEKWQLQLIQSKVPAITEETCEKFTPHMIGLKELNALSFNKGCYVGQEVVARTEHLGKAKRKLEVSSTEHSGTILNQCTIEDQTIQLVVVSTES